MDPRKGNFTSEDDVSFRQDGAQFRYAQDRLNSVLVKTGGVLPGSVPRIGNQSFVKNRITKQPQNPALDAGTLDEHFQDNPTRFQTGEPFDDNLARNREQLQKLKDQLAERERNKGICGSSPAAVGGSFEFSHQSTPAQGSAKVISRITKKTETNAYLLGIIEVVTPLRNLPVERKRTLAKMSLSALVNGTPNIEEDGLQLGPIISSQKNVGVVMDKEFISTTIKNEVGGGVHEMSRHPLSQIGVMVHSFNDTVVFIGRDAMRRRTAVILKIPDCVQFNNVVCGFKIYTKN